MRHFRLQLVLLGITLLGLGKVTGILAQAPPKPTSHEILKAFPKLKLPLHLPTSPAPGATPIAHDHLLLLELVSELLGPSMIYDGDYIAVGRYRCAGNWILCFKVLDPDNHRQLLYDAIIWNPKQAKPTDVIALTSANASTFCSASKDAILLQDGKILMRGKLRHNLFGVPRFQYLTIVQPTDSGWVVCRPPLGSSFMEMYIAYPVDESGGKRRFVQLLATESTDTIPSVLVRLFDLGANGLPTTPRDCGIITSEVVPESNQSAFEEAFELKVANGNGGTIHWSRKLETGTTMLANIWDPNDKRFLNLRLELIDDCN